MTVVQKNDGESGGFRVQDAHPRGLEHTPKSQRHSQSKLAPLCLTFRGPELCVSTIYSMSSHDMMVNFQWHKPREVYRLRCFLQANRHKSQKACSFCRKKKLKCDGQKPCSRCKKQGFDCDLCDKSTSDALSSSAKAAASESDSAGWSSNATHRSSSAEDSNSPIPSSFWQDQSHSMQLYVDWPVPQPASYGGQKLPFQPKSSLTMADSFHVMMMMKLGFNQHNIEKLLNHLPLRLKQALNCMAAAMKQSSLSLESLPLMPDDCDLWDHSGICREVIRFEENANQRISCNDSFAQFVGAHPEEVAARLNASDLPLLSSDYRMLCMHLFFCLSRLRGIRQGSAARVELHRITTSFFRDGMVHTGVVIAPDEYDAAMSRCPDGVAAEFMENSHSAHQLSGALLEKEETLEYMVQSSAGLAKLDRLADRIVNAFGLTLPPEQR